MWIRRSVLVALAGLGLSSCLVWSPQTLTTYPRLGCEVESQKHLDGIDWSKADIVDIRVRDNEFSPMVVRMTQSRPYLLRVRNRDDYRHYFTAWTFFNSVAVARVAIDGEEVEDTCFAALTPAKGSGGGDAARRRRRRLVRLLRFHLPRVRDPSLRRQRRDHHRGAGGLLSPTRAGATSSLS